MKRRWFFALALWLGAALAAPAQAGSTVTRLQPDPLTLGLRPNAQGVVSITVAEVSNLYGLELHLTFDPTLVEVVDADPTQAGVQIESSAWFAPGFVAVNQVDNATGHIDYAATLLNPAPAVKGSGSLARITFVGKHEGVSALTILGAILATRDGQTLAFEKQTGALGISAGGQAPAQDAPLGTAPDRTGLMLAAGLGGLAFVAALGALGLAVWRRRQAMVETDKPVDRTPAA